MSEPLRLKPNPTVIAKLRAHQEEIATATIVINYSSSHIKILEQILTKLYFYRLAVVGYFFSGTERYRTLRFKSHMD